MYDKDSDYKSYGCVNNNDVPTIEKWYFIEYLIKKGGNGCTKVRATDFGDAERKFAETHDLRVLSSTDDFTKPPKILIKRNGEQCTPHQLFV